MKVSFLTSAQQELTGAIAHQRRRPSYWRGRL